MIRHCSTRIARRTSGFTMSEVLIAVFVLGIGLIMLAAAFPVAADWTRQNSEESVASMVAQTATSAVQVSYRASDLGGITENLAPLPNPVVALPNAGTAPRLPWQMRAYAHNTSVPWPVPWKFSANAPSSNVPPLYTWLALIRRCPGQIGGADNRFDLYILVCKRGELLQTFGSNGSAPGRDPGDPKASSGRYYMPCMASTGLTSLPAGVRAVGASSGTIFRKLDANNKTTAPIIPNETCWFVPGTDGGDPRSSPLVYVYATTLSF